MTMDTGTPRTAAWLLMGLTGSAPGVLEVAGGRLRYVVHGRGALTGGQIAQLEQRTGRSGLAAALDGGAAVALFDVPPSAVGDVVFPWYYFGGGMKLTAEKVPFRFSFLKPQNTQLLPGVLDIPQGRAAGRIWRQLLVPAPSGR
jgi:hypothetical protein